VSLQRFFFSRSTRITRKTEFDAVYASKQCRRTEHLTVHAKPNALQRNRLGLSVPKKVGNAVVRNRKKRLIREAFRHALLIMPQGYDVVITLHKNSELTRAAYEKILLSVVEEYDATCNKR
jgi:ribonuclease P protein component